MPTIKAIPINAYPESAWRLVLGVGEGEGSALKAYRTVAAVHRCVRVRAKTVKSVPLALYRGRRDISETPEGVIALQRARLLFYLAEASMCLYGRAHALKEQGVLSGLPRLRWVASPGITPEFDSQVGIKGYKRRVGEVEKTLAPDQVWSCWIQDPSVDVGADVAPAAVAMRAAGVLDNLDSYLESFFDGGAIKATLLRVKSVANENEKKKLEAWWKKTLSGVKNAFRAAAVSADVEPMVIGDSLADTVNPELRDQALMDVLIAMEVPASKILANAANYATAQQDELSFLTDLVIPEAESIRDSLNAQFYGAQGLELVLLPEKMPAFQAAELAKAQAINALTSDPVITQSEARQMLGREPLAPDAEEARRLELAAMLALAIQMKELGYSLAQATALAGLPAPTPPEPQIVTPPALPPPADTGQGSADPAPPAEPDPAAQRAADLERWQRKALKRGGACGFASVWIDPHEAAQITHSLEHAGSDPAAIRAAFKVGDPGEGLTDPERALFDALSPLLQKWGARALTAVWNSEAWDEAGFSGALRGVLLGELVQVAMDTATGLGESIGPDLDPATLTTAASAWARGYTFDLVKGLTDTTRQVVAQATASYLETPGMTRAQLQALLQGAFSPRRAESIAVTEVTRAASAAVTHYKEQLAEAGLQFEEVWRTVNESGVCAICDPLNGKPEGEWKDRFPGGPPAHTKCRCGKTLRRVRQ